MLEALPLSLKKQDFSFWRNQSSILFLAISVAKGSVQKPFAKIFPSNDFLEVGKTTFQNSVENLQLLVSEENEFVFKKVPKFLSLLATPPYEISVARNELPE